MRAMNEGMKQRLVGALVLLALGTVILPILFDFDGSYNVDTRSTIPAAPDIQAVEIEKAGPVKGAIAVASHADMFRFDESRAVAEHSGGDGSTLQDKASGLNGEGIPRSWILQVASLSGVDKAQMLTQKLLADGYKAYKRRVVIGGEVNYRIYVGPKISKKTMLEQKQVIEKKYKLNTLLLAFEP